jgi:hypothetical protein
MRSIVSSRWQLIVHDTLGDQLYDWTLDPGESTDLTSTADGKAQAAGLKSELEGITKAASKTK